MDSTVYSLIRNFPEAVSRFVKEKGIRMADFFSLDYSLEDILDRVRSHLEAHDGVDEKAFIASRTGIAYGVLERALNHDLGETMYVGCTGRVELIEVVAARRAEYEGKEV